MITSCANSKVKRIVALQEKSKNRLKENVFVAEGLKMFEEAPMEQLKEVYVQQSLWEQLFAGGPDHCVRGGCPGGSADPDRSAEILPGEGKSSSAK